MLSGSRAENSLCGAEQLICPGSLSHGLSTREAVQAARENSCQTLGNSGARLGKYQISGRYFYFRSLFLSGRYFYCQGPSRRAHIVKSCISSISGGRFPVVIFILSHPRESQPPGFLGFPVVIFIFRSLFFPVVILFRSLFSRAACKASGRLASQKMSKKLILGFCL